MSTLAASHGTAVAGRTLYDIIMMWCSSSAYFFFCSNAHPRPSRTGWVLCQSVLCRRRLFARATHAKGRRLTIVLARR